MLKYLVVFGLLLSASSDRADIDHSTLRGDVVGSVLSTAYQGDTVKAADSMNSLATSYQQFLKDLQREAFCDASRVERGRACAQFRSNELSAIQNRTWSRTYGLAEAAFAGRTATYNFVRDWALPASKDCSITMQLSVDLDGQQILNHEFFAKCY